MKNQYEKKSSYISDVKRQNNNEIKQDQYIESKQPQLIQEQPKKGESFAQRSQIEIQVHNQIKVKNQAIKKYKAQQRQMNKPKVKTLTQSSPNNGVASSSKGFTNTITLSLIVSFVCGALFMAMYMLIKG